MAITISGSVQNYDAAMAARAGWSTTIELLGAGGEPVGFERTLLSHGVADLPPNTVAADGSRLDTVLLAGGRAWPVTLERAGPGEARVCAAGAPAAERRELLARIRHMLRLDEDLSAFYAVAAADPALSWAVVGAGRMLRAPTVFEDVVKTICTTNCAWSATVRMVRALVGGLGIPTHPAVKEDPARRSFPTPAAKEDPARRSFPTPAAMAQADEAFYRDVARAGYRGPYLRSLASDVAEGRLDLEALNDPALPDAEVAERLLAIAGVGPYAMAHMMMLLGRYRRLILDSWTRPTYRRLSGRHRITDKGIERAFRRYREFAGLAFWLTLTEDWVPAGAGTSL
jgi:3-methyladenine DNA glycosylase/8-oxoguanine DNA glycosylase